MAIYIVSGEGEQGTSEVYEGATSVRALKSRITRERAGGDRWARIDVDSPTHVDVETGKPQRLRAVTAAEALELAMHAPRGAS
jgi:hypothetical protein